MLLQKKYTIKKISNFAYDIYLAIGDELDDETLNLINELSLHRECLDVAQKEIEILINKLLCSYVRIPDPSIDKSASIIDEHWLMCSDCMDAWESTSQDVMVMCPKCAQVLHNPRYQQEI